MSLLFTLFPLYLFGNLHCIGMCGPLVLMIGRHRFRHWYFFGRILSFTLAGIIAGGLGAVINVFFQRYHISAFASLFFGTLIFFIGLCHLLKKGVPGMPWFGKIAGKWNTSLSLLMLRDHPLTTLLFGFFTIMLPCGQTVIVFSACALSGDPIVGMVNGFAFALLTSPSLYLAMHSYQWLQNLKRHYSQLIGWGAVVIGGIAICRGIADMGYIPHMMIEKLHLVIF